MTASRPNPSEYPVYYSSYIGKVKQNILLEVLAENERELLKFISTIPKEKYDFRYAEGKWSVKEILVHLNDAERIFAYRALRFARNDKTELAGFDENIYVPQSNAANRTMESILDEFTSVRKATISLFESFTDEMFLRSGKANNSEVSVRALGFIIAGHTIHHLQVIKERYL